MKILLRSCFVVNPKHDQKDILLRNVQALRDSNLGFEHAEDIVLWTYIQEFVSRHSHVPDITTLISHFEKKRESTVVERLRNLEDQKPLLQGDFVNRVEEKSEERRSRLWGDTLRDAATISSVGLTVKDKRGKETPYRGTLDSVQYVIQKSHALVTPTFGSALSGEVTSDGDSFLEDYNKVANDPTAGIGFFTGLEQMDRALKGAKKQELWIHAAFTGGMKSTTAINWAYNLSVWFRHSVCYFSLEMPYKQIRNIFYGIHSYHEKFKDVRCKLGLQADPTIDKGLEYEKIREGTLSPDEYAFLEIVTEDFNNPANNYGRLHIEIAPPDQTDFTVADMRGKAELIYSKDPFHFLLVDHAGLLASAAKHTTTTERLNEVLRDLKKLAMSFNRGAGIAVVGLFQINREGYKTALKRKEKTGRAEYDLTAMSYASECERSADVLTVSWMDDELKKKGRVQYQCLKSRDSAPFDMFVARVEWACRRILVCFDKLEDVGVSLQESAQIRKALEEL